MQPEPTPISSILILFFCFVYLITFSTINSVSGLGINVFLVTKNSDFQKNFLLVKWAIGFPKDLSWINLLKFSKSFLVEKYIFVADP